ncbi:MAG: aldo/keto reductase [Bacteroidales bacterium]|nr:aldo/keto reductase [Bacteroidales bacterium]
MAQRTISRRQFMATVAAGAGTVMLGKTAFAETAASLPASYDPFSTVTLGKTGIKTTLLGMGTGYSGYNRSSNITRAGVAESLIRTAYEKGIRYFDCADSYGTHPFTKAALSGIPRENYVLGTKMWITQGGIPENEKGFPEVVVDRFRRELNTDYLDLVQLHCMTEGDWTEKYKRHMDELENLKAKKVIRAHGVSVHSFEALEAAAASPWVDVIHVRINPFGENMDKKDASLVVPVIEKFHKAGKGVIGMKLIGGGRLKDDTAKIDESLRFVLGLGTVDLLIVGFEKPEHIDDYIRRIRGVQKS